MTYAEKAKQIYDMLAQGQLMDAFEKYYHTEIIMQELGEEPRSGKDACREYEKNFLSSIKEFHGMGVNAITSDETNAISMVESWMEVTFQNDFKLKLIQVAVQRWKDGLIVHETFYHK